MPAEGADTRGVRRPGAARSASGRWGPQPGPAPPILADGLRPHSPALSPLSAAGKFVRESNLGALQLRHRGGVGVGGGPEIKRLGVPAPQPAAEKLPPAPLSDPTLRNRTGTLAGSPPPSSGLGRSNLRVSLGSSTSGAPHPHPRASRAHFVLWLQDLVLWSTCTYPVASSGCTAPPRAGDDNNRTTAVVVIKSFKVTGPGPSGETREVRTRSLGPPVPQPCDLTAAQ